MLKSTLEKLMAKSDKKGILAVIGAIVLTIMTGIGYFADLSSITGFFKPSTEKTTISFIIQRMDDSKSISIGRARVFLYSVNQYYNDTQSDNDGNATFQIPSDVLNKPAKLVVRIDENEYEKNILKLEKTDMPKPIILEQKK